MSKFQTDSLNARDEWGLTPLLLAASYREAVDAVKTLIDECGADIGERDHDGRSVVYIAAKYNSFKSLEVRGKITVFWVLEDITPDIEWLNLYGNPET